MVRKQETGTDRWYAFMAWRFRLCGRGPRQSSARPFAVGQSDAEAPGWPVTSCGSIGMHVTTAEFTGTTSNGAGTFAAATLAAPTGLSITQTHSISVTK
jgi:hypothetical protein